MYIFYYTTNQSSIFVKKKNQWSFFVNTLIPYVQKMEKIFANPWWLRKFCWPSLFLLMRCEKIQCKNHHVKIFDLRRKFQKNKPSRTELYYIAQKTFSTIWWKTPQISQEDAIFPKNKPRNYHILPNFFGSNQSQRKPDLTKKNRASNFVFWKFLIKLVGPGIFFWNEKLNQNLCAMFWSKFFCFVFFPNAIITFFTCHIIPNIRANFPVKKLGLKPHHFTLLVFLRMYVACKNIRLGKNYYYFFLWFNPNCPM